MGTLEPTVIWDRYRRRTGRGTVEIFVAQNPGRTGEMTAGPEFFPLPPGRMVYSSVAPSPRDPNGLPGDLSARLPDTLETAVFDSGNTAAVADRPVGRAAVPAATAHPALGS